MDLNGCNLILKLMRYKITIEYDGTNYCGYQKQPDQKNRSIEENLENAIFSFSKEEVKIFASGRTDAGVHALGQVVHFDLSKEFDNYRVIFALNHYLLKEDIAVVDCQKVSQEFHSRFCAKMRHYRYIIINRTGSLTLQKNRAWHLRKILDIEKMQQASQFLIGKHDFSSFRDAECQSKTPIRSIENISIQKVGNELIIEVSARSFLHHMVRNIVGTLVWAGYNKIKPQDMKEILESKDRAKSGPNAPACGLYLLKIDY